jgi:hypothetical protein
LISQIRSSLEGEKGQIGALEKENGSLKILANEKTIVAFALKEQLEGLIRAHEYDMKNIKGNFSRLDAQYKIAFKNFNLKEGELSKLKDECKLSILEKNRSFEE